MRKHFFINRTSSVYQFLRTRPIVVSQSIQQIFINKSHFILLQSFTFYHKKQDIQEIFQKLRFFTTPFTQYRDVLVFNCCRYPRTIMGDQQSSTSIDGLLNRTTLRNAFLPIGYPLSIKFFKRFG